MPRERVDESERIRRPAEPVVVPQPTVTRLSRDPVVARQLAAHVGNQGMQRILARAEPTATESALAQLDEMLDAFNVDEEGVIDVCGRLTADERESVRVGTYRDRMASALNVSEMVRAVTALQLPVTTQLRWVQAASLATIAIDYADIRGLITGATEGREWLRTPEWRTFFVDVCNNETILQVVVDLELPLADKLRWIGAEMISVSAELDYATIKNLITSAPQDERDALKTEEWRTFFVDVCTNETIFDVVKDLGLPLDGKLDWIRAEMISVRMELGWADIRELVDAAPETERTALLTDDWRAFFVEVCDDETIQDAVDALFTTLADKLQWLGAEGVPWSALRTRLERETDAAVKVALYDDPRMMGVFVEACGTAEMAEAVILIGGPYAKKKVWLDAEGTTTEEYLDALVRLQVFEPGIGGHTPAVEADQAIADHLGAMVEGARGDGRQIAGHVAVVGSDDFDVAGINHYGAAVWATKNLNGFVDSAGRVWIHKDKGDVGTMIHEGLHKHSDEALIGISQPLNEGVTEYFTRKVCAALTPPFTARTSYTANYGTTQQLVALVGEDVTASAYFDGAVDGLESAFVAAKSEADWTAFVDATKAKNWPTATTLATP